MHVYLKVKIKTLATEARDIRKEERRININARARQRLARDLALGEVRTSDGSRAEMFTEAQLLRIKKKLERSQAVLRNPNAQARLTGLRSHRTNEVRRQARSSYLAYGFLRGVAIDRIETDPRHSPDWPEVERLIGKFSEEGTQGWKSRYAEWQKGSIFAPQAD